MTYLEMRSPAEIRPRAASDGDFAIDEVAVKQWQLNRSLYLQVGRDWHWNDKKSWTDRQWREYAQAERLRTFVARFKGTPAGYYELRRDDIGDIEIAILGLIPEFIGRGLGGVLVTSALREAWQLKPASRVWLHTCTLDHPAALKNYQARGLRTYKVATVSIP